MEFLEFERRFWNASWVVKDVLRGFHIPSYVRNEVLLKFRKAMRRGITDGRGIEKTAACFLYYVAKRDNLPLTAFEIAEKLEFDKHEMLRTYFKLRDELNLEKQRFELPGFIRLISKYAYELGLEPEEESEAKKLIKKLDKVYADPRTKVGYVLYKASGKSLKKVSKVLKVSEETICRFGDKTSAICTKVDKAVGFKSFRLGSPSV